MTHFNADEMRSQLRAFNPETPFLIEGVWQEYHALYKLASSVEKYHYSMGIEVLDDTELVVQLFAPNADLKRAKGTVVLMHGYMDHVALYGKLISHIVEQGWALLSYDLPGHGLSSGASHAIGRFSEYAAQLEQVLSHHPQLASPLVRMGQSTGGALLLEHHRVFGDSVASADNSGVSERLDVAHRILLAPLIRPKQYRAIQLQYHIFHYFLDRVKRFYTPNSHDKGFTRFIRDKDPLQKSWVSVDWIGAMLEWVKSIETWRPKQTDVTVFQGTDDQTVEWEHNLAVLSDIYPTINIHRITDARHNLANEDDQWRVPVFEEISRILDAISQ
ncbi:alpha/beta hydrolase [Neptunomonas phycophila]|uniref:alpha/beta hydrolase n=1 Tax=Neptunomonas phycophila TaxID=1572645 RepID=UPI00351182F6